MCQSVLLCNTLAKADVAAAGAVLQMWIVGDHKSHIT
jgi:hypothetical protein